MHSRCQQSQQWLLHFVPEPAGRPLLGKSSVRGKQLKEAVRFSLISLVCVAMVDETLSSPMALQAKQKPRVLHRNKRYVAPHKNRHNTCVFSLVFALFVPSNSCACFKCNTSYSIPYKWRKLFLNCTIYLDTTFGLAIRRPLYMNETGTLF